MYSQLHMSRDMPNIRQIHATLHCSSFSDNSDLRLISLFSLLLVFLYSSFSLLFPRARFCAVDASLSSATRSILMTDCAGSVSVIACKCYCECCSFPDDVTLYAQHCTLHNYIDCTRSMILEINTAPKLLCSKIALI